MEFLYFIFSISYFCTMFNQASGEMTGSSNIEDKTQGTSSVTVRSSSNGIVSALNSILYVYKSSNFKVTGEGHKQVKLTGCSNIDVGGVRSNVELDSTSNMNIAGDRNTVNAVDCSNIDVGGAQGTIDLKSVSNTKITGERNTVKSADSSNLIVQGDGNAVEVSSISNHVLQPSLFKDKNVLEVSNGGSNSVIGQFVSNLVRSRSQSSNAKKFNLDYLDAAKIDGSEYSVGIYRFKVESNPTDPTYVDVRVDPSAVSGLQVASVGTGSAVELEGRGSKGEVQKLVLKGPQVTQKEENVFRIQLLP